MPIEGADASKRQMRRVRVSPDNKYVVVSSNQDHHAAIYQADGLQQIASFPTKKSPMGFGFAADGKHAYLCCHDDAVVFEFELATGRVTRTLPDRGRLRVHRRVSLNCLRTTRSRPVRHREGDGPSRLRRARPNGLLTNASL